MIRVLWANPKHEVFMKGRLRRLVTKITSESVISNQQIVN
jgi:hypothetical protein